MLEFHFQKQMTSFHSHCCLNTVEWNHLFSSQQHSPNHHFLEFFESNTHPHLCDMEKGEAEVQIVAEVQVEWKDYKKRDLNTKKKQIEVIDVSSDSSSVVLESETGEENIMVETLHLAMESAFASLGWHKREAKKGLSEYTEEEWDAMLLHYMKRTMQSQSKTETTVEISGSSNTEELLTDDENTDRLETDEETKKDSHRMQCRFCKKSLLGMSSLKNHLKRKHGNPKEKRILCDKCSSFFYTNFEFQRHYQCHRTTKNFTCVICEKKFGQKSSLDLHLLYHKNERRYRCAECGKSFYTRNHLNRHGVTHTKQRNFKCEPCGRSFVYRDHLRRHMQSVHVGERKYICEECQRPFMYSSQLKAHLKNHTQRPFTCNHCKRNFADKVSLCVHLKMCLR